MYKHLNNWFDEVEGLEPETTNKAIKKEKERQGYIVTQEKEEDL